MRLACFLLWAFISLLRIFYKQVTYILVCHTFYTVTTVQLHSDTLILGKVYLMWYSVGAVSRALSHSHLIVCNTGGMPNPPPVFEHSSFAADRMQ